MAKLKNRVRELRTVKASDLRRNAKNWRVHSPEQTEVLKEMIDAVGFATAVIAREKDGQLEIIDGHLRADTAGNEEIPVLIIDVSDEEAATLLATLDPIAAMAGANGELLAELLAETVELGPETEKMLARLSKEAEDAAGSIKAASESAGAKDSSSDDSDTGNDEQDDDSDGEESTSRTEREIHAAEGAYVLVTCNDDQHQAELIEEFMKRGLEVRAYNV